MRLVTNQEMAEIDIWAQKELGILGTVLMENAGRGCVEILKKYFRPNKLNVLIFCGKGNNGGDGFVIARHLKNYGSNVKVILLGRGNELKGDALRNYNIAKLAGIEISEAPTKNRMKMLLSSFNPECIIDAIFGTGFKGNPEGIYYEAIELISQSDAFIFSVDIPSGINGDTGDFEGVCVVADATATMCLPKRGNYLFPGRAYCGDLYIVDIGVPRDLIDNGYPRVIENEDVAEIIPYRKPDGNKGTFGEVLIIAGASGFSGAAAMASISCLRVGVGLVRLAAPKGIIDALEAKLLEVVKLPLNETEEKTISPDAIKTILPYLKRSDAVAIGPGITTNPMTKKFLFDLLPKIEIPLVIDADGINLIAQDIKVLKKVKTHFILTPHPGELSRLIGLSPAEINKNRIEIAKEYAEKFNCILVLKGAPTIIAAKGGEVFLNPTGNSGLASAGSGDVLLGMITGFLAQGTTPVEASIAGVFLHGLCADIAVKRINEYSLIAGDLLDYIPRAINYILKGNYEKDKR